MKKEKDPFQFFCIHPARFLEVKSHLPDDLLLHFEENLLVDILFQSREPRMYLKVKLLLRRIEFYQNKINCLAFKSSLEKHFCPSVMLRSVFLCVHRMAREYRISSSQWRKSVLHTIDGTRINVAV